MGKRSSILIFVVAVFLSFLILGCGEDETGPTQPTLNLKDQVFGIAAGNGDNTLHSGATRVLLDWNGDSTEANIQKLPVLHYNGTLPLADGDPKDKAWQEYFNTYGWTTINLDVIDDGVAQDTPITSGTPISELKMMAVFNNIIGEVYFLIQFQIDNINDEYPDEPHYWKNVWAYQEDGWSDKPFKEWIYMLDYDSDWVAFMWSTWKWHLNDKGNRDALGEMSNDFQDTGCATTCHNQDHPYHLNETMNDPFTGEEVSEVSDLWVWCSTRTNYAGEAEDEDSPQPPAFIFDGVIDNKGGVWGDRNDFEEEDDEGLKPALDSNYFDFQKDEGTPGYQKNSTQVGPYYIPWALGIDYFIPEPNPSVRNPYMWLNDCFEFDKYQNQFTWEDYKSVIPGYVNRSALGGGGDILGLATYEPSTRTWTIEFGRPLEASSEDDVNFYIYKPHDYE